MLKLLVCLFCAVVLAVVMLQLRQQRLELNHQSNRLHNQIEAQQAKLWSQQLEIAQRSYMDESTRRYDDARAEILRATLRDMLAAFRASADERYARLR